MPEWARYHPHVTAAAGWINNMLYVATEGLSFDGVGSGLPGAGTFRKLDPALRLTAVGATRSVWDLPGWFEPVGGRPALGYHANPER